MLNKELLLCGDRSYEFSLISGNPTSFLFGFQKDSYGSVTPNYIKGSEITAFGTEHPIMGYTIRNLLTLTPTIGNSIRVTRLDNGKSDVLTLNSEGVYAAMHYNETDYSKYYLVGQSDDIGKPIRFKLEFLD